MSTLTADQAAVIAAGGMDDLQKGAMPDNMADANGGLSKKAPGKPLAKGEEEDEEDEDAKRDEGGETMIKKEESTCKSETEDTADVEDLVKAMDHLDAVAGGTEEEPDRRTELAKKMAEGTLEKSEREELITLLGGEVEPEEEEMAKSISDQWSEDLSDDYDVSPFLEKLGSSIAGELQTMQNSFSKSMDNQQQFNKALAKSFQAIAKVVVKQEELIKSISGDNTELTTRLATVEELPLKRKSMTGATALKKSFPGGEGDTLSRAEILGGLEQLMVKSQSNDFIAPCGEPIDRAVARYENGGRISRSMLNDVAEVLGKKIAV